MKTNAYRHRLALLTMLGAYPTIVLLLAALEAPLSGQPMPVRAAVLVPLMVLALTYFVMPTLTKLFAGWLSSERSLKSDWRWLAAITASVAASSLAGAALTEPEGQAVSNRGVQQVDHKTVFTSRNTGSVRSTAKTLIRKQLNRWRELRS